MQIVTILLAFILSFSTISAENIINFAKGTDAHAYNYGQSAFNHAPELTLYFAALKKKYNIGTVVETGSMWGFSSTAFSLIFDEVHTIEFLEANYEITFNAMSPYANVHCHFGSSPQVLSDLLPTLTHQRILFYLDAHWHDDWPLLNELETIAQTHRDNCIIVIDDMKVPSRPDIPYDAYGNHECSYEYIKKSLKKVFTFYSIYYLIPQDPACRAKLVAIPLHWKDL